MKSINPDITNRIKTLKLQLQAKNIPLLIENCEFQKAKIALNDLSELSTSIVKELNEKIELANKKHLENLKVLPN